MSRQRFLALLVAAALAISGAMYLSTQRNLQKDAHGGLLLPALSGELGTVTAVEANPAHDLLVLDGGALIPIVFVTGHEFGRLTVDVPDGLFEL